MLNTILLRWNLTVTVTASQSLSAAFLVLLLSGVAVAEDDSTPVAAGNYEATINWLDARLTALEAKSERPLLITWLFDESASQKDDQQEISQQLHRLFASSSRQRDMLIMSFGERVHQLSREPQSATGNIREIQDIRAAIDRVPIDETGLENLCGAVHTAAGKLSENYAQHKVVLVVVTDEESSDAGEKGELLEKAISVCRENKVVVFVLGPEATFGVPEDRLRWTDPVYALNHWIAIRRGPASAYSERVLWNGMGPVMDGTLAGFGPYSQERLTRETGGGFFIAMDEFTGTNRQPSAIERLRKRRAAMAGYEPDWAARTDYLRDVESSPLRLMCRLIVQTLDPSANKRLVLRERGFSVELSTFRKQGRLEWEDGTQAWHALNEAIRELENVRHECDAETSKRWQANYDLLYAQCLTFRTRLPQYLLALDRHAASNPQPRDPKHNRWVVYVRRKNPEVPTDEKYLRLKAGLKLSESRDAFLSRLKSDRENAGRLLMRIVLDHEGTPWAEVARQEQTRGFAVELSSYFHDPKYDDPRYRNRLKIPSF